MKKRESKKEDVVYVDEDGNPIDFVDGEEYEFVEEEVATEKVPGGVSRGLNRLFHFLDRGGSLGGEFSSGIAMGLLSVCVVFLNIQVIGNMLTANVELVNSPQSAVNIEASLIYARLYASSVIVSVLGTVAVGIVANLPLVQVSTMGLAGALLCLVETGAGLTYENLLFVNLIAGVAYAILVLVPGIRSVVFDAVPRSVRRGLPMATGLVLAWTAVRMSGLVTPEVIFLGGGKALAGMSGLDVSAAGMGLASIVGMVAAVALYIAQRAVRRGKPVLLSLLGGTAVFFLVSVVTSGIDTSSTDSIANFGRLWLVAGSQASAVTPFADSYLTYAGAAVSSVLSGVADVFSRGVDFSGYSGNAVALVASGVLCYLFGGIFQAEGTLMAVGDEMGQAEATVNEPFMHGSKVANAAANVAAPLLGTGGVALSPLGVAAAQDRGRSGLASLVAASVMAISLFVLLVPALLATETYAVGSMNQWNYFAYGNGGFVYLVRAVCFGVADVVIACVGVSMALGLRKLSGAREIVPAVVMAVFAVATLNIVAGVAAGFLVHILMSIPLRGKDASVLTVPMIVLEVLLIVAVALL